LALGHEPQAVIGDMDSISADARARMGAARCFHIAEQESTDFDKALRHINAGFVIGLGCLGGRVDHELSVFSVLLRRSASCCLLIGREDVVFEAPSAMHLKMRPGDRFSLFPMQPVTGQSEGLRWPIAGLEFAPHLRGGTSNEALGPVDLTMDGPGMLVILPRARLEVALAGLLAARGISVSGLVG
jgi:thiamine pyrophosphokinase